MLPDLKDTSLLWMSPLSKSVFCIYWIVIILFISGFISLFFVRVLISVRAPGIITYNDGKIRVGKGRILYADSRGTHLMGECYVSTTDISQLKPGQEVRFQLAAFSNSHYGTLTGNIYSIESDFILLNEKPVVRVKCWLDRQDIIIDNGFRAELKEGMKFQTRFITGSRTIWQLLFDKIGRRLHPV